MSDERQRQRHSAALPFESAEAANGNGNGNPPKGNAAAAATELPSVGVFRRLHTPAVRQQLRHCRTPVHPLHPMLLPHRLTQPARAGPGMSTKAAHLERVKKYGFTVTKGVVQRSDGG